MSVVLTFEGFRGGGASFLVNFDKYFTNPVDDRAG